MIAEKNSSVLDDIRKGCSVRYGIPTVNMLVLWLDVHSLTNRSISAARMAICVEEMSTTLIIYSLHQIPIGEKHGWFAPHR